MSKPYNKSPEYKRIKALGVEMFLSGDNEFSKTQIARKLYDEYPDVLSEISFPSFRKMLNTKIVRELRKGNRKDSDSSHEVLMAECLDKGIPLETVSTYWYKGKNISIKSNPGRLNYTELRDELIEEMKKYAPKYPTIKRKISKDSHLLVIDPADIHIGKLSQGLLNGTEYDNEIAVDRVFKGVQGILDKSAGYKIDKILFVAGNDVLHIDSPSRKTTSGTPQDTDGMWYSNYQVAKRLYIDILELLLQVADVHVVFNPSNHDFTNGFFLCDAVETWFTNNKNITFDSGITHRKYFKYGNSLIGTSHGDGAKPQDLPLLMAQEARELWGTCKHYYVYVHHLHHKHSKDYGAVNVEGLRSPSGTDWWHHKMGYQGAPKAVEGFIHSKENGQVGRFTHIF